MRNYSLPPYVLGEIGDAVRSIARQLNIECKLCSMPSLRDQGYYSIPTLSEDIVKIAALHGFHWNVTGSLNQTGIQLQQLIDALASKGVIIRL